MAEKDLHEMKLKKNDYENELKIFYCQRRG